MNPGIFLHLVKDLVIALPLIPQIRAFSACNPVQQFQGVHRFFKLFILDLCHGGQKGNHFLHTCIQQRPKLQPGPVQAFKLLHHSQGFDSVRNGIKIPLPKNQFMDPAINRFKLACKSHLKNLCQKACRASCIHLLL